MDHVEQHDQADLIVRAQARDPHALAELVDLNTGRLLTSIRAELGTRMRQRLESRDVLQQVYLDALRHLDTFEHRGHDSFFRWLRGIAVHRICDAHRSAFETQKRGPEVRAADLTNRASLADLLELTSASVTSPSVGADAADRIRRLEDALDRLGPDQREAIRLRHLNQLSVSEVAAKMGRSERAVRSLCVRALIQLREMLDHAF